METLVCSIIVISGLRR